MEEKKNELTLAERFTNKVLAAFGDVAKGVDVTDKERKLISNYFIKVDEQLRNSKQGDNWGMVRMNEFALTLAHTAKLGLDMSLPNMLSFIPFRHGDDGTINMVPVIGAKGYEYIAKTYGLTPPVSVTVELVYSNDKFVPHKKDCCHECDGYEFEIKNPFDRGSIIGGFGYLAFEDKTMNKLLIMSEKDMLNYRPQAHNKNFWTGENLKKMYEKTIAKQLLKKVTLNPDKVNAVRESFAQIDTDDMNYATNVAKQSVNENTAEGDYIDVDFKLADEDISIDVHKNVDLTTGELLENTGSSNKYSNENTEELPFDI